ncbi:MAG: hypothetical protein OEM82_07140 [Acidobacteriota bacterium]|nr:hypothetical protein [Acidobacteriota bacterium]
MSVFEGKTPAERNKIIAVIVLGVLAVLSLAYTFGPSIIGTGSTSKSSADQTPAPAATEVPLEAREIERLPEQTEIDNQYASIPINFVGSSAFSVPVTGRNIFAFWEPGDPTPVPSLAPQTPTPFVPTPQPTIDYKIFLSFVTPQSVFAGSKGFTLEVNGDKFQPGARILFNGSPIPTAFRSEQRLTAEISASLISLPGNASIVVDIPGTELFSRQIAFPVQDPPKPEFEYIGMIARQHYNNDTAYFQEKGARTGDPFSARLNDVLKGRFRVISISEKEVEFQDTRLGFKHKLPLLRPEPGTATGSSSSGFDEDGVEDEPIPGIPSNIRRVTPRRSNPTRRTPNTNQKIDDNDQ